MDCAKVGKLILQLRKEKGMTQRELADAMNISDRTISKWERGFGCPDVTLLKELSEILGVNIDKILGGSLHQKSRDSGNIRRAKFYACPHCSNTMFSTSEAEIFCCGRKVVPLKVGSGNDSHSFSLEEIENDYFVVVDHEMSKEHYIAFVAYVSYDKVLFIKLYPEQAAQVRFPKMHGGKIYVFCNKHGIWSNN